MLDQSPAPAFHPPYAEDDAAIASRLLSRSRLPADRESRIDWLFSRWEEIDAWIDANRPA